MDLLGGVQEKETRMIWGLENVNSEEKWKELGLFSLEENRRETWLSYTNM